ARRRARTSEPRPAFGGSQSRRRAPARRRFRALVDAHLRPGSGVLYCPRSRAGRVAGPAVSTTSRRRDPMGNGNTMKLLRISIVVVMAMVCIGGRVRLKADTTYDAVAAPGADGWRALFDGTSLDAWRGYKSDKVPAGWRIVDRTLAKDAPV